MEFSLDIDEANLEAVRQLVLAGFPRMTTLTDFLAYFYEATPRLLKIFTFTLNKSFLSMLPLGSMEPTRRPQPSV
jgi:hypothetical protein